jgi:hypothetical protein
MNTGCGGELFTLCLKKVFCVLQRINKLICITRTSRTREKYNRLLVQRCSCGGISTSFSYSGKLGFDFWPEACYPDWYFSFFFILCRQILGEYQKWDNTFPCACILSNSSFTKFMNTIILPVLMIKCRYMDYKRNNKLSSTSLYSARNLKLVDPSVSIVTDYGSDDRVSTPSKKRDFSFHTTSKPAVGTSQFLQNGCRDKRSERVADFSFVRRDLLCSCAYIVMN